MKWKLKIVAKYLVGLLNIPYGFWQRLGVFRHGEMDNVQQAIKSTISLIVSSGVSRNPIELQEWVSGKHFLELGPGDSTLTGQIPLVLGASSVTLIDAGNFATSYEGEELDLQIALSEMGFIPRSTVNGISQSIANAQLAEVTYLTKGLESLQTLPDASVDFSFSNAVFEHIRREEIIQFAQELKRVHRRNSSGLHRIDFRDHLFGGRKHLLISERVWNSSLTKNNGLYLNRVSANEFVRVFSEAGFDCEIVRVERQFTDSFAGDELHPSIVGWDSQDLSISGVDLRIAPAK